MFTQETTSGYKDEELDTLNAEWARIVAAEGLEPDTDEYNHRAKQHADKVAGRTAD